MTCTCEQTATLGMSSPDACLHVNYAKGMVLGVDDFTQEFAYLNGRDEWAVRELAGYGTLNGLAVVVEDDGANGPRVRIKSGSAASPRGTLICVPVDQCASLNMWLARPEGTRATAGAFGSPASLELYVTLCYTDCTTSNVPIPGEPCRSDDELMQPSRIADGFRLELRSHAPSQQEEDAVRELVRWLASIPVEDAGSPSGLTEEELIHALRIAASPWLHAGNVSPPSSPPASEVPALMLSSPPETLRMHPHDRCELLRAAFRLWVTELRPLWHARCCDAGHMGDDCVLLARLVLPIVGTSGSPGTVWQVAGDASGVRVDESRRPFLVQQRLLQEWLQCGSCCATGTTTTTIVEVPVPTSPPPPVQLPPTPQLDVQGTADQVIVTPTAPNQVTLATPQDIATTSVPTFDGLNTTGRVQIRYDALYKYKNLVLGEHHHCVACMPSTGGEPAVVLLPRCAPRNRGRVYIVKALADVVKVRLQDDKNQIEDGAPVEMKKGESRTFVSDGCEPDGNGRGHWYIIARA